MEKQKLTIPYIVHNWKTLKVKQKRAIVTVLLIATALLLFLIALIVGIASCAGNRETTSNDPQAAQLPALLLPPERTANSDPETGSETNAQFDPNGNEPNGDDEPNDEPDANDNPSGGTETSQYKTLKKHDKGEEVTVLQTRLMELGYLEIEETTDYFGSSTEYALELFQRQHDLKQDGVAGAETLSLLYSADAQRYMLKEGAEGRDVKMLQEQLVDLGYLSESEVDRVYGSVTIEAVKSFQKRNGLSADGLAGEKTLEKLYSDEAKISKSLEAKLKAEEKGTSEKSESKSTPKTTPKASSKTGSKTTPKTTAKATPKPTATPKKESRIEKFIKAANSKIGCEYVLGDRGPKTFDCSGFVWYCLKQAGVSTNRLNASGFSKKSSWKNISNFSDIQKGDILFFRSDSSATVSHCGIYIGSNMMIDASSANGKVVKRSISSYWKKNFVNARRPW